MEDKIKHFIVNGHSKSSNYTISGTTLANAIVGCFRSIIFNSDIFEYIGEYRISGEYSKGINGGKGGYVVLLIHKLRTRTLWVYDNGYLNEDFDITYNRTTGSVISNK